MTPLRSTSPYARITGTGSHLPPRRLTNDDMVALLAERGQQTSDEWIVARTGIRARHFADEGVNASDLALPAARAALQAAGRRADDVDLIIVATSTPDMVFPSTACILQHKLGANGCAAFDLQAVCSGFVYALTVADAMVRAGGARCALVVGSEVFSRILDFNDRSTCVLFGDGAGAVVLEPGEGEGTTADRGLLGFALRADGTKQDLLYVDGGVSTNRQTGYLRMLGNQVFRHAVVNISEAVVAAAADAGIAVPDVDWFIPHQANQRILEGVAKRLGIDETKVISTVAEHANTSAASIPLALNHGIADGRIKPGQLLLLEAMGGGLTWGACVLRL